MDSRTWTGGIGRGRELPRTARGHSKVGHELVRVLILRTESLNRFAGLLESAPFAQQVHKVIKGSTVATLGTIAQRHIHPTLVKRSFESPTCVDIRECEFRELGEPLRADQQTHVPQMTVVRVMIGGVALGTGTDQRYSCVPISDLFRCLGMLVPLHGASIAQCFPLQPPRKCPNAHLPRGAYGGRVVGRTAPRRVAGCGSGTSQGSG